MSFIKDTFVKLFRNANYEKNVGKPETTEIVRVGRDWMWDGFINDIIQNQDYILLKKAQGKSYAFYQEMEEKDPHLFSVLQIRKKAITGLPWDVLPYVSGKGEEAKRRDQIIAWTVKESLKGIPKFKDDKFELLDGIAKGFAVSEIIWGMDENRVYVKAIHSRKQSRFVFGLDGELRLLTDKNPFSGEVMPDRKFLVFCNQPYAENPYGTAILKECYWYWWFKKNCVKWWAIFSEKFAAPHLDVTYPSSGLSDQEKEKIDNFIDNFQSETGVRHPEGVVIKLLEAVRRGEGGYQSFMDYCDDQISKAVLCQTLTTSEGRRSGSMALGNVHADVRQDVLEDDTGSLDVSINQLGHWIVDYNFANVDGYPTYVTSAEAPEDLVTLASRDKILFAPTQSNGLGVPIAKKYFYGRYNIPEPKEGEELLETGLPVSLPLGMSEIKTFASKGKRRYFHIGNTLQLQDRLRAKLESIYRSLEPKYLSLLEENAPLKNTIDELVRNFFDDGMKNEFYSVTEASMKLGVENLARQFDLRINPKVFQGWMDDYLKYRIYEKGKFEEIGQTLSDLLHGKAKDLYDQKLTVENIRDELKAKFSDLADWKAQTIARTEVNSAANYGAIQMMKDSGLDVKAWFFVDPASCDLCQDWAAKNPYRLKEAEDLGLPHPNCNDQWVFTVEE